MILHQLNPRHFLYVLKKGGRRFTVDDFVGVNLVDDCHVVLCQKATQRIQFHHSLGFRLQKEQRLHSRY